MNNLSIAVISGGSSSEREISIQSGNNIQSSLIDIGIKSELIDFSQVVDLEELKIFEKVFIAMHGVEGESGNLQNTLETLGIKFTGSKSLGCKNTWNKKRFKDILLENNLPTPKSLVTENILGLAFPKGYFKDNHFFLKPIAEGSSLDTFEITSAEDFLSAKKLIKNLSNSFILEEAIKHKELTVAILGGEVLPILEIQSPNSFYDYHAKYISNKTKIFEANLTNSQTREIKELAKTAFDITGCSGWGRVDILQRQDGAFFIIEINTVPGMTSHSLFPKAASLNGITFKELINKILDL